MNRVAFVGVLASLFLVACSEENNTSQVLENASVCDFNDNYPEGMYCKYSEGQFVLAPQKELMEEGIRTLENTFKDINISEKTPVIVYKVVNTGNINNSRMALRFYPQEGQELEIRFELTGKVQTYKLGNDVFPQVLRRIPAGVWGEAFQGDSLWGRLGLLSLGVQASCSELTHIIEAYSRSAQMLNTEDLEGICVTELQVKPFTEIEVIKDLNAIDSRLGEENGGQVWPHRLIDTQNVQEEFIGFYNADLLEMAELQKKAFDQLAK